MDALARHGKLPDDAESVSVDLARLLRARITSSGAEDHAARPIVAVEGPPDWLRDFPEADRLAAFADSLAGGAPLHVISYQPEEGCFYRGEDPFNLFRQLTGLKALLPVSTEAPQSLEETDPFRCTLSFRALVAQPRGELEHLFRYVIEQVSITALAPEALVLPTGESGLLDDHQAFVADATARLAARDWAGIRNSVATLLERINGRLWSASALRCLDAILTAPLPNLGWAAAMVECIAEGRSLPLTAPSGAAPTVADRPKSMAARLLAEQRRALALPGNPDEIAHRAEAVKVTVSAMLASLGLSARQGELTIAAELAANGDPVTLDALLSSLERRIDAPANAPAPEPLADLPATGETRQMAQVLKVDQAKIDSLMNLIGELVVSKNSLPFLAKRAEEIYGSREMSREIKEQYAVIDRLAQELQRSIMAVRMLPVSDVFERFTRLIRDLARKLEKQIDLKIEGEDTAADKTIIEALGDPLIHLVRNSIDHGIELPADRVDANKPETATILLKAYQEGDQVVIEVSDDGRGIDPAVIRQKAIEKGLITEEQAGALSDQDAINLVFLPGFSTVKKISDLSGRGVGMDVVRNAVEKVHGEVTISSRKGEGTTVRLSLPLSMAVSRVMMVEAADGLFGIPMDAIAETVRIPRGDIRIIKQAEVFVLRDAIIPIVRLHDLLALGGVRDATEEEAIVVARVGNRSVGLVIDRFREGIDVILKPLDGVLAGMRGFSGSALLGDGRILLVLNLKELL